jgi:hypothetical protein
LAVAEAEVLVLTEQQALNAVAQGDLLAKSLSKTSWQAIWLQPLP